MQAAVITFDHLAYAFLGCYGNSPIPTPNFDGLAASSVVFDQCFGASADRDAFQGLTQLAGGLRGSGGRVVVQNCRPEQPPHAEVTDAIADWRQASHGGSPALLWLRCSAIESPWSAPLDRILACWSESFCRRSCHCSRECGIEPVTRVSGERLAVASRADERRLSAPSPVRRWSDDCAGVRMPRPF
jgi:hypothetical protein